MNLAHYVTLDPTGNITCLVTRRDARADEREITRMLMDRCEQVAYLEPPVSAGARARVRLMGGEFCGNAAMASACYLARRDGVDAKVEAVYTIDMSGCAQALDCRVRDCGDHWSGTVPMPPVREISRIELDSRAFTVVRFEGIAHIIMPDSPPGDDAAEALLKRAAQLLPEAAVGLIQWNEAEMYMRPLVMVKDAQTMVWETGCGSGSAAVGAYRAYMSASGEVRTRVRQPGGVIEVYAKCDSQFPRDITITGDVRIGAEEALADKAQS